MILAFTDSLQWDCLSQHPDSSNPYAIHVKSYAISFAEPVLWSCSCRMSLSI